MKIIFAFILLFSLGLSAQEFRCYKERKSLSCIILKIPFPQGLFASDLKSGLSTFMISEFRVSKNNQILYSEANKYKVFYDLWDEKYFIKLENNQKTSNSFKNIQDLFVALSEAHFKTEWSSQNIKPDEFIQLDFEFFVDPIEKDKKEKIKKMMHDNQVSEVSLSFESRGASPSKDRNDQTSQSTSIRSYFHRILDSELEGDSVVARWHFKMPTKKLTLKDLENEK